MPKKKHAICCGFSFLEFVPQFSNHFFAILKSLTTSVSERGLNCLDYLLLVFSPNKDETRNRGACSNLFLCLKKPIERKLSCNFKVNFNIGRESALK